MISYLFYIFLGFLPSLIWLLFYLRKDSHPEPKTQVIQIFIWGMLIAPLAADLEFFLLWLINPSLDLDKILLIFTQNYDGLKNIIGLAVFAPLVEEYLKYKIVKTKIINDSDFDEPTDAMLYMIIGALGFAAVENLIITILKNISFSQTLVIIIGRFIGATFLHALASGIAGYYFARSLTDTKIRYPLIIQGLTLAIIFHGSYNYFISSAEKSPSLILIVMSMLSLMASFVSYGFKKLRCELSVCDIK